MKVPANPKIRNNVCRLPAPPMPAAAATAAKAPVLLICGVSTTSASNSAPAKSSKNGPQKLAAPITKSLTLPSAIPATPSTPSPNSARRSPNPSLLRLRQSRLAAKLQFSWRRTRRFRPGRHRIPLRSRPGVEILQLAKRPPPHLRWQSRQAQNVLQNSRKTRLRRNSFTGWSAGRSRLVQPGRLRCPERALREQS